MPTRTSYEVGGGAYDNLFGQTYLPDEAYEQFSLDMPDDRLDKMLIQSLDNNVEYWNQSPWKLQDTDRTSVDFFLGDQMDPKELARDGVSGTDNRLFTATRAILSYATGSLAKPEVSPSRSDAQYVRMAKSMQTALYQHAKEEHVDAKVRAAVTNLIVRKRAFLKLRYDPTLGSYGDILTEVCNPEDIIIDRNAKFMDNPNIVYHRLRCSVEDLLLKFPGKAKQIKEAYAIKQGRWTQMSRFVTYFEAWFSYYDAKGVPREGVCWFLPQYHLILDKMPNPNWIYTGDDAQDKQTNVLFIPPKPFVWFNYLSLGHSFIDETSLFEQAKPLQEMLNRRNRQFNQNVDFMNGRYVGSKKAFSEEDAYKFVNRGARTMALVDAEDVTKAVNVLTPSTVSPQVFESLQDFRNEIDGVMGTPSIFKGGQPDSQDTLGRDQMVKQQAGMLQDDLVRAVTVGMERYYQVLLQMMRVYYTDDYWFSVKGGDGKQDFIMLNGDAIDANVRVTVETDSTLPVDKEAIRATSMELAQMKLIDPLTLFEDLGVPDPEIRAERLLKMQMQPFVYMGSVMQDEDNSEAELDIQLVIADKEPTERDNYDENYLKYFNNFITLNRFAMLPQDAKQRLISFLSLIQHQASQTEALQASMPDSAGMLDAPPIYPPKTSVRLMGNVDPNTAETLAAGSLPATPPAQPPTPPTAPAPGGQAAPAAPAQA